MGRDLFVVSSNVYGSLWTTIRYYKLWNALHGKGNGIIVGAACQRAHDWDWKLGRGIHLGCDFQHRCRGDGAVRIKADAHQDDRSTLRRILGFCEEIFIFICHGAAGCPRNVADPPLMWLRIRGWKGASESFGIFELPALKPP